MRRLPGQSLLQSHAPTYNVYNDGANNPSTTPGGGKEGFSKLHVSGAVVLAMDGHVEFMKESSYWEQAKISKKNGGLIWISPSTPSGAATWVSPQPNQLPHQPTHDKLRNYTQNLMVGGSGI